jgi:hypothetical protein
MSNLKKSPAKRKSDAKEGVYFKKIKVVPKLKLSDATLQRDRMDNDGFADGQLSESPVCLTTSPWIAAPSI